MSVSPSRSMAAETAYALQSIGSVCVTRFFAGSGLSLGGVQFGFIMKGVLYLRINDRTRSKYEALGCHPFSYSTRAKRVTVSSYYEAPADILDEPSMLCEWAAEAHHAAMEAGARARPMRRSTVKRSLRNKAS